MYKLSFILLLLAIPAVTAWDDDDDFWLGVAAGACAADEDCNKAMGSLCLFIGCIFAMIAIPMFLIQLFGWCFLGWEWPSSDDYYISSPSASYYHGATVGYVAGSLW